MKIYFAAPPNRPSKISVQKFMLLMKVSLFWSYHYLLEKSTFDRFKFHINFRRQNENK